MKRIWTIGHSTRAFDDFVDLLQVHGIGQLADVRSLPSSRRHPHFVRVQLERALPPRGVVYRWMPGLGGLRHSSAESRNTAWKEAGFRAYADHMATPEFAAALQALEASAHAAPTSFMCAEADFRHCHRQLLSDALVARGWEVLHIASPEAPRPHTLTSFAHVGPEGEVTYPGDPQLPF